MALVFDTQGGNSLCSFSSGIMPSEIQGGKSPSGTFGALFPVFPLTSEFLRFFGSLNQGGRSLSLLSTNFGFLSISGLLPNSLLNTGSLGLGAQAGRSSLAFCLIVGTLGTELRFLVLFGDFFV